MKKERWSIAFVVPRYGAQIVGGAETLARGFAERLPPERFAIEVLTTCARDHHTWRNVLEPGAEQRGALTVRRFAVSDREIGRFLAVQQRLSDGFPLDLDEELEWAASSVNSEPLFSYLDAERDRFDAFIFLPYLFGTTLLGSQIDPRRSVLIPCLHDEPFAYLKIVEHLFRSVRGAVFNSAPERSLARRLFGVAGDAPVVGFGFDPVERAVSGAAAFRSRYGVDGDYLLYFGRKEGGRICRCCSSAFALAGAGAVVSRWWSPATARSIRRHAPRASSICRGSAKKKRARPVPERSPSASPRSTSRFPSYSWNRGCRRRRFW